MTSNVFLEKIEENRGKIKNRDKYLEIAQDILLNGIEEMAVEAYDYKRVGLNTIHKWVMELSRSEQSRLIKEINSVVKIKKIDIELAYAGILNDREGE